MDEMLRKEDIDNKTYTAVEAHMHVGIGTATVKTYADIESYLHWLFDRYKNMGITKLRDGGDRRGFCIVARDIAPSYGIDYRTPIYALYKRGFYGKLIGQTLKGEIQSASGFKESFETAFSMLLKRKPDHFKIPLTGVVPFEENQPIGDTAFNRSELKYMIESAKDHGLYSMVHANGTEAICMAAELGAASIEHGYQAGLKGLEAMAEHDCVWVPTLAPFANLIKARHPSVASSLYNLEKVYNEQLEALNLAHSLGVKIAVGSDAGAVCVPQGQGYLDEINCYEEAGFSLEEIRRMAHVNGSVFF